MTSQIDGEAAEAIRAHHGQLRAGLRDRVLALLDASRAGHAVDATQATVLAYLDEKLLPHAAAEEVALYPAGDVGGSALLVRAMREEHRNLVAHVDQLRTSGDGIGATATASAILALFESHLSKENDLLIPVLLANPDVSLHDLLGGMHELVGG